MPDINFIPETVLREVEGLQQSPRALLHSKKRGRAAWHEDLLEKQAELWDVLKKSGQGKRFKLSDNSTYINDDAIRFLRSVPENSIHAIVTDPPYGLIEYEEKHLEKMDTGRGGVWRIPPSFDGSRRAPLPRFTVLTAAELQQLEDFFSEIAINALRAVVPGGHVIIASNPLLSTLCFHAFQRVGFEKRGEIIRLVQTLRGGYKPKGAEYEFPDVSVMPRSCWEPWGIFRKPFDGTVAQNLRKWGAGGLRRPAGENVFKDVIPCSPTRGLERQIAPHPSLKPQRFMRQVVWAALPLGIGTVYDPFAGGGSTLAAAEALGYYSIGTDRVLKYVELGKKAFPRLSKLEV